MLWAQRKQSKKIGCWWQGCDPIASRIAREDFIDTIFEQILEGSKGLIHRSI